MEVDDKIKYEKLQYDINKEAAQISSLSSGEIRIYQYLTGEEILSSNQSRITEQGMFTYSPVVKTFEKQMKTVKDQGE